MKIGQKQHDLILARLADADHVAGIDGCRALIPLQTRKLLIALYSFLGAFVFAIIFSNLAARLFDWPETLGALSPFVPVGLVLFFVPFGRYVWTEWKEMKMVGRFSDSLVVFDRTNMSSPKSVVAVLPLADKHDPGSWMTLKTFQVNGEQYLVGAKQFDFVQSVLTETDVDRLEFPDGYPAR